MPCTLSQLQELLRGEGLRYFLIPDEEGVVLTVLGDDVRLQFRILIQDEGRFLQFRSDAYLFCPVDHPHLVATLQAVGAANYGLRLMKFGWDPRDGEIAAYADLWIMDAEVTQEQFGRMADAYISVLHDQYEPLRAAIDSGAGPVEPGEPDGSPATIDSL